MRTASRTVLADNGAAMTAHQYRGFVAERFRKASSLLEIADEHVGVAKVVSDVPDRHVGAHASRRVNDLPHLRLGHRIRNNLVGVVVNNRADVGPGLEDRTMDGPFAVHDPPLLVDRIAVEVKLHNVVDGSRVRDCVSGT